MLGEFSFDDFDEFTWIFFFLATLVNFIVMCNLLIAIISSTYERVISDQIEQAYKERVSLICDIQMISYSFQKLFRVKFDTKKLLFLAWEDPENDDAIPDYIEDSIDSKQEMAERTLDKILLLTS